MQNNLIPLITQMPNLSQNILQWLHIRQQLIVQYFECASYMTSNIATLPTNESLQKLQELLIDYSSQWQFHICYKLAHDPNINFKKLDYCYTKIYLITKEAMTFIDTYNDIANCNDLELFKQELSHFGEILADRLNYEDLLLDNAVGLINITHKQLIRVNKCDRNLAMQE